MLVRLIVVPWAAPCVVAIDRAITAAITPAIDPIVGWTTTDDGGW